MQAKGRNGDGCAKVAASKHNARLPDAPAGAARRPWPRSGGAAQQLSSTVCVYMFACLQQQEVAVCRAIIHAVATLAAGEERSGARQEVRGRGCCSQVQGV